MHEIVGATSLAAHPFARLKKEVLEGERPYATILAALDRTDLYLAQLDALFEDGALPVSGTSAMADALVMSDLAERMVATGLIRHPALLDPFSPASQNLQAELAAIAALRADEGKAALAAQGWSDPFDPADTVAALELAGAKEGSLFAVFSGAWRKLRASIEARYDFSAHAVRPKIVQVLEWLAALHDARSKLAITITSAEQRLGSPDLEGLLALRSLFAETRQDDATGTVMALARSPVGCGALERIAQFTPTLRALDDTLGTFLDSPGSLTLDQLGELARDLRENLDELPDLLPFLAEVHAAVPAVAALLTRLDLPLAQIEALVVDEAIARRERANPDIRRFDIDRMIAVSRRAAAARELLRDQNSAAIRAALHRKFRDNVKMSETSVTQLDNAGRSFKKIYAAGRRELEHEFAKTMRYKSIRELASGDSGRVVNDLKPVWLMSPLSVSDTLPLEADLFDVVIFDEASQIPTEDAIPALCRSRQVVIVGDEMQLPPTSFFSASQSEDELEVIAEEDGERVAFVLDADSLLSQAARNLPATLLAWHYRSRSEALISFSNAAFYAGELVTIPDRTLPGLNEGAGQPAESASEADWLLGADRLLAAPITTHRMADGLYERRANLPEARYIAGLVRELLARKTGQSIGIVAFSEAQQSEIEDALDRLGAEDQAFAAALAREMERDDDGKFNGLFVKNLENVQGDERDIILMSVCYAPGSDGRMAMNFGPINQRGGEKRLNVIFSRARRHMAIVSSIAPEAITNLHNDGARALRSFLAFAEAQSAGAHDNAQAVLATLNPDAARTFDAGMPHDPVSSAIAQALRVRGHEVHEHVGGASFRCDLAIADPAGSGYALGVLLDRSATDSLAIEERFVFRPAILRAFGWRVIDVPVTAWLRARSLIIERIEQELTRSSWDLADANPAAGISLPDMPVRPAAPLTNADDMQADIVQLADPQTDDVLASAGMTEYRLVAGTSNKFWRVGVDGQTMIVEFGRVGTRGQRLVKTFEDEARARREANKLTLEKTGKGYELFG
jgi:predicted DNA-binding WGR domain protein